MLWIRNNLYYSDEPIQCKHCQELIYDDVILIENNYMNKIETLFCHLNCYPLLKKLFLRAYSIKVLTINPTATHKKGYFPYISQIIELTSSRRDCFDVADEQEPGVEVIDHTNPLLRMDKDSPLLLERKNQEFLDHQKRVQEHIEFLDAPLPMSQVDSFFDGLKGEGSELSEKTKSSTDEEEDEQAEREAHRKEVEELFQKAELIKKQKALEVKVRCPKCNCLTSTLCELCHWCKNCCRGHDE